MIERLTVNDFEGFDVENREIESPVTMEDLEYLINAIENPDSKIDLEKKMEEMLEWARKYTITVLESEIDLKENPDYQRIFSSSRSSIHDDTIRTMNLFALQVIRTFKETQDDNIVPMLQYWKQLIGKHRVTYGSLAIKLTFNRLDRQ